MNPRPPTSQGERLRDGRLPSTEDGSDVVGTVLELIVQVDRRADEREMAERLREVTDLLPRRPDLLGVKTKVVGVGQHLLESQSRVVQATGARQRVDVPERADRERPFRSA